MLSLDAMRAKHGNGYGIQCTAQGGSKGVPRRFTPILKGVREEVVDGSYALVSCCHLADAHICFEADCIQQKMQLTLGRWCKRRGSAFM